MTDIYRNIYVKKNMPKFSGHSVLYYSGRIVFDADGVLPDYDRSRDIYLGCDCDASKYSALIKTKTTYKNEEYKRNNGSCSKCSHH